MLEQLIIVISVTFLCMISPGPDMIIIIRNTFLGGQPAGLKTSLGVLSGNLVHISYCVLGVGWLVSQSILAFNILKYAGAAYLIYLGVRSLMGGGRGLDETDSTPRVKGRGWFLQGFANNILNPKGTLFYLGVFTVVITPETPPLHALFLVLVMMAVSALFWLAFIHTLERPVVRSLLDGGRQILDRLFGVLLIAIGMKVAVTDR